MLVENSGARGPAAFLFDIDFTLVDLRGIYRSSYRSAYERNNVRFEPELVEATYGMEEYSQHKEVLGKLGYSKDECELIVSRIVDSFRDEWRKQMKTKASLKNYVCSGAVEFLDSLESKNIPRGYVTLNIEEMGSFILEKSGLSHYFSFGAYSDGKGGRVPVLKKAISGLGQLFDKKSIYVVGDSIYDILAAKRLSLNSIGVTTGFYSSEELRKCGANVVVESLDLLKGLW